MTPGGNPCAGCRYDAQLYSDPVAVRDVGLFLIVAEGSASVSWHHCTAPARHSHSVLNSRVTSRPTTQGHCDCFPAAIFADLHCGVFLSAAASCCSTAETEFAAAAGFVKRQCLASTVHSHQYCELLQIGDETGLGHAQQQRLFLLLLWFLCSGVQALEADDVMQLTNGTTIKDCYNYCC